MKNDYGTAIKLTTKQNKFFNSLFNELTSGRKYLKGVKSRTHLNKYLIQAGNFEIRAWEHKGSNEKTLNFYFNGNNFGIYSEQIIGQHTYTIITTDEYVCETEFENFVEDLIQKTIINKARILRHMNRNEFEIKARRLSRKLKQKQTTKRVKI